MRFPSVPSAPGDIFAVVSDGIFESTDAEGALFGVDRMLEVIRQNRKRSASEILHELRDAVTAYTKGAPAHDDRTMVVIKRKAKR